MNLQLPLPSWAHSTLSNGLSIPPSPASAPHWEGQEEGSTCAIEVKRAGRVLDQIDRPVSPAWGNNGYRSGGESIRSPEKLGKVIGCFEEALGPPKSTKI